MHDAIMTRCESSSPGAVAYTRAMMDPDSNLKRYVPGAATCVGHMRARACTQLV